MVSLMFKCPVCSATAKLEINERDIPKIEKYIKEHGKSPTYATYCENGHHIAVLVSIKKEGSSTRVYPREVFEIANNTTEKSNKDKDKDKDSIDWIIRHFG